MKALTLALATAALLVAVPQFATAQPQGQPRPGGQVIPKIQGEAQSQVNGVLQGQPQPTGTLSLGSGMNMPTEAVAVLVPKSDSKVEGTLLLQQEGDTLHITGKVSGLTPGKHGFHIHEFGDLRDPKGDSAGGHFNPTGMQHGSPDDAQHHMGDFGNIEAGADGTANVDVKVKGAHVALVLGRGIVVHGSPDDLKTQPSGNAGPRVAVGVIGVAQTKK